MCGYQYHLRDTFWTRAAKSKGLFGLFLPCLSEATLMSSSEAFIPLLTVFFSLVIANFVSLAGPPLMRLAERRVYSSDQVPPFEWKRALRGISGSTLPRKTRGSLTSLPYSPPSTRIYLRRPRSHRRLCPRNHLFSRFLPRRLRMVGIPRTNVDGHNERQVARGGNNAKHGPKCEFDEVWREMGNGGG